MPIILLVVVSVRTADIDVVGSAREVTAPVRPLTSAAQTPVQVALEWNTSRVVAAPAWSGVVQRVFATPGVVLSPGKAVVEIDGIKRIAIAGQVPLYRKVTVGDSGLDARAINTVLKEKDLLSSAGNTFNAASLRALRQLAPQLGLPSSISGADPAWFVWIPTSSYPVRSSALAAGFPAPAPGQVILTSKPSLRSAFPVPAGTIDSTGAVGTSADPIPSAASTGLALAVPRGSTLSVGGETIALDMSNKRANSAGLATLGSLATSTDRSLSGVIVTRPTGGRLVVPTASVVDANGVQCVLIVSQGVSRPARIAVVADLQGQTVVTSPQLSSRDSVAVAPPAEKRSCA